MIAESENQSILDHQLGRMIQDTQPSVSRWETYAQFCTIRSYLTAVYSNLSYFF